MKNLSLGKKQERFAYMLIGLLQRAHDLGFAVRVGDTFRDPRVFGAQGTKRFYSAARSAHKNKLAIDLNLFKHGKYLTKTSDHRELGEYWESVGGTWGGRWSDGNHYSLEHNGVK